KLLALAEEGMKKLTNASDRFSKLAAQNAWSFGAAFQSASKQQGHLLPDLTADKGGSRDGGRHDRCTTCHQGIDRPLHDKATLAKLSDEGEMKRLSSKLAGSMEELEKRQRPGENLNFTPDNLPGKTRGSAALVAFLILACALVASLTLGLLQQSARSGLRVFLAGGLLALGTSAALALFSPRVIGIEPIELSPVQIQQFAAHPRLDLFVDSKSPHAMEKFGCTICHAGQGSATEFHQAGHSPNSSEQLLRWQKEFHGQSGQTANTSMLSHRFIESSCLKCHHQVTDLVRQGVKEEAPKLLKGYELAREHGCFGCHEIQGMKNGRPVGPDMRLEPSPALEWLDSEERQKALSDPSNPPGTYRKVGPSLRRLAEKTNMDWTVQWILDPRGFRADTRMPHFYNLSTNAPGVLPEDQKEFPSAEIQAMSHYLIQESKSFLQGKDNHRQALLEGAGNLPSLQESLIRSGLSEEQWKDLQTKTKQFVDLALLATPRLHESINALFRNQKALQEKLHLLRKSGKPGEAIESEIAQAGKELRDVTSQLIARSVPAPLSAGILDESGQKVTIPTGQGDPVQGRLLFTEKGCLACHAHDATRETYDKDGKKVYGVSSQANFGPDLTRIADKIAPAADQVTSRTWLIQWLLNPNQYHPRTKMPITYLTPAEASDMAAWLLAQKTGWVGAKPEPNQPAVKTYQALARMYLSKAPGMTASEVDQYLPLSGDMPPGIPQDRLNALAPDSEERILQQGKVTLDGLKWYVGKKSLARLGCYGCHDIPGFENHKLVGIGLNDWGRKEGGQLPFEDAEAFVRSHFRMVPDRITRTEAEKRVKILSEKPESELTAEESRELRRLEERLARQQSAKEGETSEPGEKQAEGKESGAAVALSEPFFEAGPGPDGKSLPPLEDFFQISLKNHQREGFLNLKLLEPRAFDFNRSRPWDERLRMPQHRFTRSRKMPEESDSAFVARQEKEEAEAREAVMTFVLGLVGEAVPEEYLPKPGADKKAEAVGLQVLEKFNCASCHQVRPGIYDFKAAEVQSALERSFTLASGENGRNFLSDHLYPGHNSWFGAPASSDQLSAFGYRDTLVTEKAQELEGLGGTVAVRLAEAFRFTNLEKITRDMPQGTYLYLPQNAFH
ncbi:MAG: c-type cytochrome, partial [Gemmataceae bacterium]